MDLGSIIKQLRKEKNMKQSELAEKAGISRVAVGNYERNVRMPNAEILLKIANALDVPVADLLDWDTASYKTIFDIQKAENTLPVFRRDLKEITEEITFDNLKQMADIYNDDFKNSIYNLWSDYLVKIITDWFYLGEQVDGRTLNFDLIYLSNVINDLLQDFINNLIPLTGTYSIEKGEAVFHKISNPDFSKILEYRMALMNEIEKLIDTTISKTITNLHDDLSLFGDEIEEKYGDNNKETPDYIQPVASHLNGELTNKVKDFLNES